MLKLDNYNAGVKEWADEIKSLFKSTGARFGIIHRENSPSPGPSINKFRNRFFSQDGAIAKIGITFPRSLIYPHKGAGKGRGGAQGSRWVDRYGNAKKTNPTSLGKMGTGGRKAKPFINEALDSEQGVNKLATLAAEHLGDALVGNLFIN